MNTWASDTLESVETADCCSVTRFPQGGDEEVEFEPSWESLRRHSSHFKACRICESLFCSWRSFTFCFWSSCCFLQEVVYYFPNNKYNTVKAGLHRLNLERCFPLTKRLVMKCPGANRTTCFVVKSMSIKLHGSQSFTQGFLSVNFSQIWGFFNQLDDAPVLKELKSWKMTTLPLSALSHLFQPSPSLPLSILPRRLSPPL